MRWLLGMLGSLVVLVFGLFLVRQTADLVGLASTLSPALGRIVFVALLVLYAACLAVPALLFLRFRQPLIPPPDVDTEQFREHMERLARRLARNPLLGTQPVTADRGSIESALAVLDQRAAQHITREASVVFLSTAISQSGSLDALLVLAAQSRMIWTVARVYEQRPGVRQMLWLYATVGATAFAAQAVEDLDVGEMLEPVIAPALAATAGGSTVVLAPLATLVGEALLQGTANALLTLRVGCIARRYCRGLPLPDRQAVRRAATREATGMLGDVVVRHAGAVTSTLWSAGKRLVTERGLASLRGAARVAASGALGAAIFEAVRRALASAMSGEGPARDPRAPERPVP